MRKFDGYLSTLHICKCMMTVQWVDLKLKSVIFETSSYFFFDKTNVPNILNPLKKLHI